MSTLEYVLNTCQPVADRMFKNLPSSDLCRLGSSLQTEDLKQSIGQELKRRGVVFDLYFEPGSFGYNGGEIFAKDLKIHLPKFSSNMFDRVRFNRQQIEQLLTGESLVILDHRIYQGYTSRHAADYMLKNSDSDICWRLNTLYSVTCFGGTLFILRVALDLETFECSCVTILHLVSGEEPVGLEKGIWNLNFLFLFLFFISIFYFDFFNFDFFKFYFYFE